MTIVMLVLVIGNSKKPSPDSNTESWDSGSDFVSV